MDTWTPENEYDTSQLFTKRVLYAFNLWMFRLSGFSLISSFVLWTVGVYILGFILVLMYKIAKKIQKNLLHHSNKQKLDKIFMEQVKNYRKKQRTRSKKKSKNHWNLNKNQKTIRIYCDCICCLFHSRLGPFLIKFQAPETKPTQGWSVCWGIPNMYCLKS